MNLIFTKNIELQDAKYRLVSNNNNETSIFIPKENGEAIGLVHDEEFTFYLSKENVFYTLFNTFNYSLDHTIFEKKESVRIDYKKIVDIVDILKPLTDLFAYRVKVSVNGNRFYLKELRQENKFNLRDILIGGLYEFNFYQNSVNQIQCEINLRNSSSEDLSINEKPTIILEDNILKNIIYLSFKYLLENYSQDSIFKNAEIIDRQIEGLEYKGLIIRKYFNADVFIGLFSESQTNESLKSGGRNRFVVEEFETNFSNHSYFTSQWYDDEKYKTNLRKFNDYLDEVSKGALRIIKEENIFKLVKNLTRGEIKANVNKFAFNKIYFGPPGTGKSHAIKEELKNIGAKSNNYSRVSFHPDYDYHSFVGGYKPFTDTEDQDTIKYKFVPQVFTELYVKAWDNTAEDYYLVIEEINRGNCAEIFGDIFQLLDRNPEYNIEPSSELKAYLKEIESKINEDKAEDEAKVKLLFDGQLQMPNNLSIFASMNTSDQSLYPMDSAFKRRWDWHYVPIDIECTDSNFTIRINDKSQYYWLDFLSKVNEKIYSVTKSEDKQIGNWFINACKSENIISKEIFINKVLFYLWNDVFKDEVFNPDNIFIEKNTDGTKNRDISFNDFYKKGEQDRLLIHLLSDILNVSLVKSEYKEASEYNQDNQVVNEAAEPNEEYKEGKSES